MHSNLAHTAPIETRSFKPAIPLHPLHPPSLYPEPDHLGNFAVMMERSPAPGPPEPPFSAIRNQFTPINHGNRHASLRAARSRRATPVQGAFAWGALLMPGGRRSVAPARPRGTGHRPKRRAPGAGGSGPRGSPGEPPSTTGTSRPPLVGPAPACRL